MSEKLNAILAGIVGQIEKLGNRLQKLELYAMAHGDVHQALDANVSHLRDLFNGNYVPLDYHNKFIALEATVDALSYGSVGHDLPVGEKRPELADLEGQNCVITDLSGEQISGKVVAIDYEWLLLEHPMDTLIDRRMIAEWVNLSTAKRIWVDTEDQEGK